MPDIAAEVIWTSGGIDKLEVCRGLRIREVWIWQGGALRFFLLQETRYVSSTRSRLLPGLDPTLIVRCISEASQTAAVRALRAALRSGREE